MHSTNQTDEANLTKQIFDHRLSLALMEMPRAILDIGTGTGDWALDMADQHPGAHVIGIDLSPIQPDLVAPNLEFQIADCEEEWTFQQSFDLIHLRNLNCAIENWPQLISRASDQLCKGGWLELIEFDITFNSIQGYVLEGSAIAIWQRLFLEAARLNGRPVRCCRDFGVDFRDAGLQQVQSFCAQVGLYFRH